MSTLQSEYPKLTRVEKEQIRLLWKQTPAEKQTLARKRELGELYGVNARTVNATISNGQLARTTPTSA